MLRQFKSATLRHKRNAEYQFWSHENHAECIFSEKFGTQKLNYIHNNPIRAGIVQKQNITTIPVLWIMLMKLE